MEIKEIVSYYFNNETNLVDVSFRTIEDEEDVVKDWIEYHGKIVGFENLYIIDNYKLAVKYRLSGIYLTAKNKAPVFSKFFRNNFRNSCIPINTMMQSFFVLTHLSYFYTRRIIQNRIKTFNISA